MALSYAYLGDSQDSWGNIRIRIVDITFDNSYPANGYVVNPGDIGYRKIFMICCNEAGNTAGGSLMYQWDTVNGKLLVFYPSGGGAASPGALADPAIAAGAVGVTSAAANGSSDLVPGRGKQVATGTDLSTVVARALAYGN